MHPGGPQQAALRSAPTWPALVLLRSKSFMNLLFWVGIAINPFVRGFGFPGVVCYVVTEEPPSLGRRSPRSPPAGGAGFVSFEAHGVYERIEHGDLLLGHFGLGLDLPQFRQ